MAERRPPHHMAETCVLLDRSAITLESRFADRDQPVLLTGIQALLRLLLEQQRLDQEAGLHTAGFVSGYRGSPLGGLDRELGHKRS
jgi:indolepyruvate ferredoxin oxidoreductase